MTRLEVMYHANSKMTKLYVNGYLYLCVYIYIYIYIYIYFLRWWQRGCICTVCSKKKENK